MRASAAITRQFLELIYSEVTESKTIRDLILDQTFAAVREMREGRSIQTTSAHGTSITYFALAQAEGLSLKDLLELYDYLKQLYDRAAETFGENEFTQLEIKNKMMSAIVAKNNGSLHITKCSYEFIAKNKENLWNHICVLQIRRS